MVTPPDNWIAKHSNSASLPTGAGIVIDLGTGDGRFVYQSARQHPEKFYIGIDPSPRPLAKISEKIHRRPEKGGLPNALFVQAALEDLPSELDGVASELHVHFPWGSLLRAVAGPDAGLLMRLRRICSPNAWLEIVIGLGPERDRTEMERLGLRPITNEILEGALVPGYREAGILVTESGMLSPEEWPKLKTTWAHRLHGAAGRSLTYIIGRAMAG